MKDNDHLPKYIKMKNIIEDLIGKSELKPGERIPTENELSRDYNVSRHTVRKALELLEREGKLEKKQGIGTFYCGNNQKKSGNIGFVSISLHDYIFADILHGVDDRLHQNGYQIILGNSKDDQKRETEILKTFLQKNVEGLIIEPAKSAKAYPNIPLLKKFIDRNIPVVLLDSKVDGNKFNSITIDDFKGGYLATEHLIDMGHKRIAIIYKAVHKPALDRLKGYKKAMKVKGLTVNDRFITPYYNSEFENVTGFAEEIKSIINGLVEFEQPTAIFCFNDQIAVLVNELLQAKGLNVPEDISLVGFDNSSLVDLNKIAITSVAHPRDKAGDLAAKIVLSQIENGIKESGVQKVFKPELVKRQSVREIS